ncbi:rhodanese-like domain-containing protein [Pseudohalocynthiibacter aestuariivivens]|nr:rhodanese-like domain-containing protein [Pseudohalocynthiibacter aestuariivivens]QIE46646.1 rhodanese-like domain-containing protein [Pseudohalocynthiibacter aestuariivivens]
MQTEKIDGGTLDTMSVDEVAEEWEANRIVLIDVRTPPEFMMEHIGGAMLMPVASFDPAKLPSQVDKRIVLMCGSDKRSGKMARQALASGLDRIAHMQGGFGAWKKAGQPHIAIDMASGAPKKVDAAEV